MCGRFNAIETPGLQNLLKDLGIGCALPSAVNLAPTERIPLVKQGESGLVLDAARWWLTPSWSREVSQTYAMFNARSETLASSKAFRGPFKRQRGLVPMSGFIEWRTENGAKQPWLISNVARALAVAALWDIWEGGEESLLSCTLVTTEAAPSFRPWHARMPVVLTSDEWPQWLDNGRAVAADSRIFRNELKMDWRLNPLDRVVSNARNKDVTAMAILGDTVHLS
ncbi:MAG: SOS response-associated peptidase [Halieaceae bacterium]|nr:SOS response-associated peptidase [Halieaceae bacterium]MCP4466615.1 SOS response-associated peptidase [Halieaceae bacterium]MCP4843226.1 SOS response-associated peptidase [Halieaceae bacterium]